MKKLTQMRTFNPGSVKNKTIVVTLLTFIVSFVTGISQAKAYIPDLGFILKKAAATTGRKMVQLEQELTFKAGEEEAKIDETWLIEGDRNLKLTATGKNFYKDNIRLNYLYNNRTKTFLLGKNKHASLLTTDFYQKLLFTRSRDSFLAYLKEFNIAPNVRLSRAQGQIAFLLGQPSEQTLNPHLWFSQDDFVLRKIRTPSGAEIMLGQIEQVSNDLWVAREQIVKWNDVTVTIRVKKINGKAPGNLTFFYPQNLTSPSEISFANRTPLTGSIEEFYSRFR